MHNIKARNVNYALVKGLDYLRHHGVPAASRNGSVVRAPGPVTTVYARPFERVLFNAGTRRPNPFFHLFESLWMLQGRWDARWLDAFVADFSSRYSDYPESGHQHGAYGKRWRDWFVDEDDATVDQLDVAIRRLKADRTDRRCVIQMWDANMDLDRGYKDVPCNLVAVPSVQDGMLDLNVFCRSNDAVWGAYGANAVHFSVLQEYLAAGMDVGIGVYRQISVDFHCYEATTPNVRRPVRDPYNDEGLYTSDSRIVQDFDAFDDQLDALMDNLTPGRYAALPSDLCAELDNGNPFLSQTALPMWNANVARRAGNMSAAYGHAADIAAKDWRRAAIEFLDGVKWKG